MCVCNSLISVHYQNFSQHSSSSSRDLFYIMNNVLKKKKKLVLIKSMFESMNNIYNTHTDLQSVCRVSCHLFLEPCLYFIILQNF